MWITFFKIKMIKGGNWQTDVLKIEKKFGKMGKKRQKIKNFSTFFKKVAKKLAKRRGGV